MTALDLTPAEIQRKTLLVFAVGRIADKVVHSDTGCAEFTGAMNSKGYGVAQMRGRRELTHRLVYEFYKGAIPDGLVIDHLCRNRMCCNPEHLEAVTTAENNRRAAAPKPAGELTPISGRRAS